MLALASVAAVLSQINNQFTRYEFNGTSLTNSISGQFYVGTGKYVKVNEYTNELSGCTATTNEVTVGFAKLAENYTCSVADCQAGMQWNDTDGNAVATCLQGKMGAAEMAAGTDSDFCVAIEPTTDFNTIAIASPNATAPQYIKAYGDGTFAFFIFYNIEASCTFTLTLEWNARAKDPANSFFVTEADTMVPTAGGWEPEYSSALAALPRHSSFNFVVETKYLPMTPASDVITAATLDINSWYMDLGAAPMLELSFLGLYVTSIDATSCPAAREGTDLVNNDNVSVFVKESYDCNAFTDASLGESLLPLGLLGNTEAERTAYASCCSMPSASSCNSVLASGTTRACYWVETRGRCYPDYATTTIDVSGMVGLNDSVTFASSYANRPHSTYVPEEWLVNNYYDGTQARRWHLVVSNNYATSGCNIYATASYVSTTTGGLCEPSSRRLCDQTEETCVMSDVNATTTPIYWDAGKARLSDAAALEVISEDRFKTCNCLKQREVCYRKNGCVSTKKYQLILMNCLDQGCGNYCNSAGSLQLSLLSVVLVVMMAVF